MNNEKTIFIAIAAYNEIDVISTIQNCLDNAVHPERLHFGLALHYCDMERPVINFLNTKTVDVAFGALLGVCNMRQLALNLYDGEDFYLQLDGHSKFDQGWDEYIIDVFYQAKGAGYDKPLFTNYVPWWSTAEDGSINHYTPVNTTLCGIMQFTDEVGRSIPQQGGKWTDWENNPYDFAEHHGFSAHFVFADAQFIHDVPPDTDYMFYGEEPTTALRAWTRGYRIFSIKKATVWHKNKDKNDGVNHSRDRMNYVGYDFDLIAHNERKAVLGWRKAQRVLSGQLLGFWGAPDFKSYVDYVEAANYRFDMFYSKNLEHELNRVDPEDDLGYNKQRFDFYELRKRDARGANDIQRRNFR